MLSALFAMLGGKLEDNPFNKVLGLGKASNGKSENPALI